MADDDNICGVPKTQIAEMRKWLDSQPLLPKDVDDRFLARFVHSCHHDLEKTKAAAQLFFNIRASSLDLINNRDFETPAMKKALKILNLAHLNISGNRQLWIWQLNDPGLDQYDYIQDAKCFFLLTDAWLLNNNNELFSDADIVIMDVKDISLKFLTKFNVSVAKRLSKYQGDAMPIRLSQVHIVNTPSFIDKLFALIKPFLKADLTKLIHFHTPNSNTFLRHIDKADLPSDYGGTLPSMAELNQSVSSLILKHREQLNKENLWCATVNPMKKPSSETASFRNLAID